MRPVLDGKGVMVGVFGGAALFAAFGLAQAPPPAAPQPTVIYGRATLDFDKAETFEKQRIEWPEGTFAETPAVVVSESGSSGSWVFVKAEELKGDGFTIACVRDPAGKNAVYHAQVAWVAVGKPGAASK